ncbi:MAG: hypothetical protein ABSD43_09955 [Terracidiphilus sp.]|jgi:hypothetical protein
MNLDAIQAALREAGFDGWLFYSHHHRDPIGGRILGPDEKARIAHRWYCNVPAEGEPRKLAHCVEPETSDLDLFIAQPTGAHFTSQGERKN